MLWWVLQEQVLEPQGQTHEGLDSTLLHTVPAREGWHCRGLDTSHTSSAPTSEMLMLHGKPRRIQVSQRGTGGSHRIEQKSGYPGATRFEDGVKLNA